MNIQFIFIDSFWASGSEIYLNAAVDYLLYDDYHDSSCSLLFSEL